MPHLIPPNAVDCYSAAPSPTTVSAVVSLHNSIRDVLGSGYETFLQGSYKNDTGVADLNDVDIVALRNNTTSCYFTGTVAANPITWTQIFQEVQDTLEASSYYRGKTKPGDKCITVNTNFKADVVPAVYISDDGSDPIAVYSFREGSERKNFPRVHYQNNVAKHQRTSSAYKPTVRMFKRWARNWFKDKKVAPSFYVECLVYSVPDEYFTSDGAISFFLVGKYITEDIGKYSVIYSVAGDKNILTASEWKPENFGVFQEQLNKSIDQIAHALRSTSGVDALRLWRGAFNE